MLSSLKNKFNRLKELWSYADSQPTEILLACINIFLTPIASYIELGGLWFFEISLILSGLYQLNCIATNNLYCRIRGALITFGFYMTTLVMYLFCIGLPTPSHWGWLVLVIASFSSLRRLKREQLSRL